MPKSKWIKSADGLNWFKLESFCQFKVFADVHQVSSSAISATYLVMGKIKENNWEWVTVHSTPDKEEAIAFIESLLK